MGRMENVPVTRQHLSIPSPSPGPWGHPDSRLQLAPLLVALYSNPTRKSCPEGCYSWNSIWDEPAVSTCPGCFAWSKQAATGGFLTSFCIPFRQTQDFLGLLSCAKPPARLESEIIPQNQLWERNQTLWRLLFLPVLEEAWRSAARADLPVLAPNSSPNNVVIAEVRVGMPPTQPQSTQQTPVCGSLCLKETAGGRGKCSPE